MNLKDLIRKPNITYTPENVNLDEPIAAPISEEFIDLSKTPVYAEAADIKQALELELTYVDDAINSVAQCIPDVAIPIPEEYRDIIELDTLDLSTYMSSMSSVENRDVLIQEIFEDYHTTQAGEPSALLLPVLSSQRSALSENLASMSSCMNSALSSSRDAALSELNTDAQAFLDSIEYGEGEDPLGLSDAQLQTLKDDIQDSQELRDEVFACAQIAAQVMDPDLWPSVFDSETARRIEEGALDAVSILKRIKGLLVISAALKSTDYKSVAPVLRDYVQRYIVNVQLKIVTNTMISIYRHYVGPVADIFQRVVDKTANFTPKPIVERYIPTVKTARSYEDGYGNTITTYDNTSVAQVMHDMAEGCLDVIDSLEDKIADAYLCSRKQHSLRKKSTQSVREMIRIKRTILQIDTVIAALQVATLQPMEALRQEVAPGVLSNMLTIYSSPTKGVPDGMGKELSQYTVGATPINRLSSKFNTALIRPSNL